ncbi:MAG: pilus assembly protein TadB [Clostridiales bacterium]|jgi:tight adherence protein B|nr:pilus assembly protein TadB [Clostridiales bacterium]
MEPAELVKYLGMCAAGLCLVGYIFYHNLLLCLLLMPASFFFLGPIKKNLAAKRKRELMFQFRDALTSLTSSLSSGSVVETAIEEAIRDLQVIYPYENVMIINEFSLIVQRKRYGSSVEEALKDFSLRANLQCITDFVDVFSSVNSVGGNNIDIIRNSVNMINDKIEIENGINILVSGKKLEQRILTAAPLGFIWILSIVSGDYLTPMFTTIQGHMVMTGVLMVNIIAYMISSSIMNIEL